MATFLIITGIVVIVIIILNLIKVKPRNSAQNIQNKNKSEINSLLDKMHKEIFPNGQKDIEERTKKLLLILNYSIDEKTAQNIFVKSSRICYISSMNGHFSNERLKQHLAPYALQYFMTKH